MSARGTQKPEHQKGSRSFFRTLDSSDHLYRSTLLCSFCSPMFFRVLFAFFLLLRTIPNKVVTTESYQKSSCKFVVSNESSNDGEFKYRFNVLELAESGEA